MIKLHPSSRKNQKKHTASVDKSYNNREGVAVHGKPLPSPAPISCGSQTVTGSLISHGYDRLEVSLFATVPSSLIAKIRTVKEKLQEGHDDESLLEYQGISWLVQRVGIRNYPYVIKTGDITVCLSARGPQAQIPSASIRIGSVTSQEGAISAACRVRAWFEHQGMYIDRETVARFDYAVDIRVSMANITRYLAIENLITRATYTAQYHEHRKLTGLQVGKGNILCRIYNKGHELETSGDVVKREYYKERFLGSLENVVRVEFQLRSKAIREYLGEERTVKELERKISKIWADLTQNWLRVATRSVNRGSGNQRREIVASFWKVVTKSLDYLTILKRKRKQCLIASEKLIKQAVGCLSTVVAQTGQTLESIGKVMTTMEKIVRTGLLEVAFDAKWQAKYLINQQKRVIQF